MIRDVVCAWRQVRSNRLFSLTVILILAVGIGANLITFILLNALLLTPLPVKNASSLFILEKFSQQQSPPDFAFSYGQFREVAKHTEFFSDVVAEQLSARSDSYAVSGSDGDDVTLATTQIVSPNYFLDLGVRPFIGRVLTEADARVTADEMPAVIGYGFWQTRFGSRWDVLGKRIKIKGFPFVIVGVLPRSFHSIDIDRSPDIRLPISAALPLLGRTVEDPRNYWSVPGFRLLAHLRKAVAPATAAEALLWDLRSVEGVEISERNTYRPHPSPPEALSGELRSALAFHLRWLPASAGVSQLREKFSNALTVLMGAVGVLLVLICANVATLLLTKAEPRRKEMALRLAIGATRSQIARQLVVEYLLLATAGAAAGTGLAYYATPFIVNLLPATRGIDQRLSGQLIEAHGDARVITFLALTTCVALIGSSALPLRLAATTDLASELKGVRRRSWPTLWWAIPTAVQVALSFLLALQGALSLGNYLALERLDPGFERKNIMSVTVEFTDRDASHGVPKASVLSEARRQVAQLSGIRSVAYARYGLMRGSGFSPS